MIFLWVLGVTFLSVDSYRVFLNYTYTNSEGEEILQYTSDYDTSLKRPYQISFIYTCDLARASIGKTCPDRPSFHSDSRIPLKDQAVDSDYKNSGVSRGHLGTAKFFCFNSSAFKNTFFLTNVAPQYQNANLLWNEKDEVVVLGWAAKNPNCIDNVPIDITVYGSNGTIGKDKVSIPNFYVNGVCEPHTGNSVCFYGENFNSTSLHVYYGSMSECEKKFDFTFFQTPMFKPFPNCLLHKDNLDAQFWGLSSATNRL